MYFTAIHVKQIYTCTCTMYLHSSASFSWSYSYTCTCTLCTAGNFEPAPSPNKKYMYYTVIAHTYMSKWRHCINRCKRNESLPNIIFFLNIVHMYMHPKCECVNSTLMYNVVIIFLHYKLPMMHCISAANFYHSTCPLLYMPNTSHSWLQPPLQQNAW